MRSRLLALALATASFALPFAAHAGGIPSFGPIIPTAYNVCPASWGLLITVINNIISLLITLAIVFVAPLTIAWAGFLLVVNQGNSGKITEAKKILTNTVVGIVIALAGYLIVAAIMAVLYNPSSPWGPWADLISGNLNDTCLQQKGALPGDNLNQAPQTGISTGGLNAPPSAQQANGACDPSAVLAGAAAGGYPITPTQANILACIAQPESQCGAQNLNYKWGNGSSAAGAFQVLLATNSQCYENTACYQAAGLGLRGQLNCASGFSNGNPKTDAASAAIVAQCTKAASNLDCSASAAGCLLKNNGGNFSPWQADLNNAKQTGCITSGG